MENSTPELTLGQRLAADTPTFFKKVELVGLALAAIGGSLTQVPNLPIWVAPVVLGIAATLAVISKFAVKDTSVLANPNATIQDYSAVLADLPSQYVELQKGISDTIAAVKTGQVTPAVPPAETPIVKEVPVIVTAQPTVLQQVASQQASSNLTGSTLTSTPAVDLSPATPINPNVTPQN